MPSSVEEFPSSQLPRTPNHQYMIDNIIRPTISDGLPPPPDGIDKLTETPSIDGPDDDDEI
jgi:hypothetical protein